MEPPASGSGRFVHAEESDEGFPPKPFARGFPHLLSHDHLIQPELEHPVGAHITQSVCPAPATEVLQRQNIVSFPVIDYPEGREI